MDAKSSIEGIAQQPQFTIPVEIIKCFEYFQKARLEFAVEMDKITCNPLSVQSMKDSH